MSLIRPLALLLAAALLASAPLAAQSASFIGVRVDADRNKVLLEIPAAPPADGRAASTDCGANEACAPSAVRNRAGGRGVNSR